jgi:hypothetical protein
MGGEALLVKVLVVWMNHHGKTVDPGVADEGLQRPGEDRFAAQAPVLLRNPLTRSGSTSCSNDEGGD